MNIPVPEQTQSQRSKGPPRVEASLAEALAQYESPLLRYVGQFLRRETAHEAEDLVQETFLRFYRQVARDGEESIRDVRTWLFRTAHNLAIDAYRRRRVRSGVNPREGATAQADDVVEEMMRREACERAIAELHQLPEEQRQVLLLRMVHGMKLREISEVTGLTPGNAGYRISQGLQELARRLKVCGAI